MLVSRCHFCLLFIPLRWIASWFSFGNQGLWCKILMRSLNAHKRDPLQLSSVVKRKWASTRATSMSNISSWVGWHDQVTGSLALGVVCFCVLDTNHTDHFSSSLVQRLALLPVLPRPPVSRPAFASYRQAEVQSAWEPLLHFIRFLGSYMTLNPDSVANVGHFFSMWLSWGFSSTPHLWLKEECVPWLC